jgi:multiple sugar transport system ATP-binding protein
MADVLLDDVTRVHADGTVAVDHLSLHVRDHELLALLGPSGCGKSTTLRLIAGIEPLTSGTIAIGGRVVTELAPHERDVAMVFETNSVYPHMTGGENLRFGLTLRGLPQAEIDQRVQAEARVLRIRHLLHRLPKAMSAGQRQRVGLGRATVRLPRVFLLDEPLTHLDEAERRRLRTELNRVLHGLGVTTLYVTHDQSQAMAIGDRVAVMRAGRLEQVGSPGALYREPANTFVATFLGSPPMNLLPGRIELEPESAPGGAWIVLGAGEAAQRLRFPGTPSGLLRGYAGTGRPLTVGIRPEHLSAAVDAAAPPERRLTVTSRRVDHLGAELLVTCDLRGAGGGGAAQPLTARLEARHPVRAGEQLELAVEVSRLSYFDPSSGTALWHGT